MIIISESAQINYSVTLEDATHLKANEYKVTYSSSNPSVVEADEKSTFAAKELQRMNSIRSRAEEVVLHDLIYSL